MAYDPFYFALTHWWLSSFSLLFVSGGRHRVGHQKSCLASFGVGALLQQLV
jgi:hypothetical protein